MPAIKNFVNNFHLRGVHFEVLCNKSALGFQGDDECKLPAMKSRVLVCRYSSTNS